MIGDARNFFQWELWHQDLHYLTSDCTFEIVLPATSINVCILIEMDALPAGGLVVKLVTPFYTFLILNSNACHFLPIFISLSMCVYVCVCVCLSLCHIEAGIWRGIFFLVDTYVDWNLTLDAGSQEGYV
jgi:hypothetical protein